MTTTTRNVYPAIGIEETNYSDGWERDDPITIATFDTGECCCPMLRRLPDGDLVVGVGRGGDFHFADNYGAHIAWFRSRDNGLTWAEDREFCPPYGGLFVLGEVVRSYDVYGFAIKGRYPRRYLCRYAESTDGGQTFATRGISTYDTLGHPEGDSPYLAGALAGGVHGQPNIGPWREVLGEAGWTGDDWAHAPVGFCGMDHHSWLALPDGSLLNFHQAAKWNDWRSGNTLLSRSTDGGISWDFVARVNPERYERVEGYSEASPMLHEGGRITVIMRNGGGGFPLVQAHSFDEGRTWTPPEDLHPHSPCVRPGQIRLRDGALALVHGRPGMFVCFDPVGDSRHWEFNGKHDLWDRETLTLQTQARPTTDRKDLRRYMDTIYGLTREDLAWARPELVDGYMSGWENLAIEELPNGELLAVYDVQNWISEPGAPPLKTIRAVRMQRKTNHERTTNEHRCRKGEHAMTTTQPRQPGEKRDVVVYANPDDYASFPQIARTDDELVLLFQVQNLAKLRAVGEHPHYQKAAVPRWATSRDGGLTWAVHDTCPKLGPVRDISYSSAPLKDGGTVTLTFSSVEPLRAIVQQGRIGYRPYQQEQTEPGDIHPADDLGPFERFWPHGIKRLADGALLAAGYAPFQSPEDTRKTTVAFLASTDEGRTWAYRSHVPNANPFDFSEPDVIETRDGRLVALLRADWDLIPVEQRPEEARVGYGYFLCQTESADGGRAWSEPVQLGLWGHPPYLVRLAGGSILLVYGYRRPPWEIRAILSRDEGRTWDMPTLRTVHTFNPGSYDMGYPVATQLEDGSIVCAFYGYSTDDVGEKMPHGIFVSIFDETWLRP